MGAIRIIKTVTIMIEHVSVWHDQRCRALGAADNILETNRASQALAEAFSSDQHKTYSTIAEESNVPHSTLYRHKHEGTSQETKFQRQQYLTIEEDKALVLILLLRSSFGQPVRIKDITTYASLQHRTPAVHKDQAPHDFVFNSTSLHLSINISPI